MSSPPRVVVSDDEVPLVRALARILRRHGIEPIEDTDGEVVALAQREHPDLILLDVHQKVDGIELLKRLKHNPATHDVRVVMMSGDDSTEDRSAALFAGAEDYLVKPFGIDVVEGLILELRRQRGE